MRRICTKSTKNIKIGIENGPFCPKMESKTGIFDQKWNFEPFWGSKQNRIKNPSFYKILIYNKLQLKKVTVK